MMKRAAITIYVLVSLPVLLAVGFTRLETTSSYFENFEDLSPLVERGWLPEYFPRSATEIKERHNMESNDVSAYFLHDGSDAVTLEPICTLLAASEAGIKFVCPPYEEATNIIILRYDGTGSFERISEGI